MFDHVSGQSGLVFDDDFDHSVEVVRLHTQHIHYPRKKPAENSTLMKRKFLVIFRRESGRKLTCSIGSRKAQFRSSKRRDFDETLSYAGCSKTGY